MPEIVSLPLPTDPAIARRIVQVQRELAQTFHVVDPLDVALQYLRRNGYPNDTERVCSENCVHYGGTAPCRCYGTDEETTEGGW